MACRGCTPKESSPEYNKRFKPENNSGCGIKDPETCDTQSLATEGSALFEWEKKHGRVITETKMVHIDGRSTIIFRKIVCPKTVKKSGPASCCSFKYKIIR